MNIELLGPLGSGKGTQARLLVQKYGFFYLGSGQILRELAKKDKEVSEIINTEGKLLGDDPAVKIFENYLNKSKPDLDNILFDGFPRTIGQYKIFSKYLSLKGKKINNVVFLDISEAESVRRTEARRYCEDCGEIYNLITNLSKTGKCDKCGGKLLQRADDTPNAIRERLGWYQAFTVPLMEEFEKQGILIRVDGERPIEEIFEDIVDKLEL